MEDKMLVVDFAYTDEFGQETRMAKTLTQDRVEYESSFYILFDEFKRFLLTLGFDNKTVNSIQIKED